MMVTKERLMIGLLILCLALAGGSAEGKSLSEKCEERVLPEIAAAFPEWTVDYADTYSTGMYKDHFATFVEAVVFRTGDGMLWLRKLTVAADPLFEGKPIEWQIEDRAPVPVTEEAAERIATMPPEGVTYGYCPFLEEKILPGCASFMLREGETWTDLGVMEDSLVGVSRDSEGRERIHTARWDGTSYEETVVSPAWEKAWSLNTIHSANGSLELHGDHYCDYYMDCFPDGKWRLTSVNNDVGIYYFYEDVMLDVTYGSGGSSNGVYHYGSPAFPRELSELDLDSIPWRGADLAALLDASAWACVREDDTPLYSAPDGEILGLAYARLAGKIAAEEDGWVCLQIGSEARGMRAWFRRDQMAFGAETENVRCGFPDYNWDEKKETLPVILNRNMAELDTPFPVDHDEDGYPKAVWLIARMTDGGFLTEVNEDYVGVLAADAFAEILPPYDEDEDDGYFNMTDEEWEELFSEDEDWDEDWNEDWDEEENAAAE
ncbi:MAG: hypothetical protein IKP40_10145 [Clostridia bacterium]|nr:hypothetical protein [Clostridia bacterium]